MPTYRVGIKEMWIRSVVVEADNEEDAKTKAYYTADEEEYESEFLGYDVTSKWHIQRIGGQE